MNEYIKAWRENNRKQCPGDCGTIVAWDTIMCRKCHAKNKSLKAQSLTVAEIKATKKARWTQHVRWFSQRYVRFSSCEICGYSKHVETAHIKPVASFPDSATIKEINDRSNLIGLCPNHHWEFDNGMILLQDIKNKVLKG